MLIVFIISSLIHEIVDLVEKVVLPFDFFGSVSGNFLKGFCLGLMGFSGLEHLVQGVISMVDQLVIPAQTAIALRA